MITEYSEFPDYVPRERIVRECLDTVGCLGKGWGTEDITFIESFTFPTRSEAQRYLMDVAGSGYDGYAVMFRTYDSRCVLEDKTVRVLRDEVRVLEMSVNTYKDHVQVGADVKDKYIVCKSCGSSLSVEHLKRSRTNACPLCHADLRSPVDIARIAALEAQLNAKRAELHAAEDNAKKNLQSTGSSWLVQYRIAS